MSESCKVRRIETIETIQQSHVYRHNTDMYTDMYTDRYTVYRIPYTDMYKIVFYDKQTYVVEFDSEGAESHKWSLDKNYTHAIHAIHAINGSYFKSMSTSGAGQIIQNKTVPLTSKQRREKLVFDNELCTCRVDGTNFRKNSKYIQQVAFR